MKLIIWGTGCAEKELYKSGLTSKAKSSIVGYLETRKSYSNYRGFPVYDFSSLPNDYDFIIVAFNSPDEAIMRIREIGIDTTKVLLPKAGNRFREFNSDPIIKWILSEKAYIRYLSEYGVIEGSFYEEDIKIYEKMNTDTSFSIDYQHLYPIISDKYEKNGVLDEYFWQDLWAAKKVFSSQTRIHWDVGSSVRGFLAHLIATGIDVNVIDIRQFSTDIEGLHIIIDDATYLKNIDDNSIGSFSALCSLEHFGLGRYGDPILPNAWEIFIECIQKKVKVGGNIYISVPVGRQRVEFNAHRIFYAETIVKHFYKCKVVEYSIVKKDCSGINMNVGINDYDHIDSLRFGLFHFVKNSL